MRLLATLLIGATLGSSPRPEPLPAQNQALLLLRVLAYDRNLRSRAGRDLTVAVLYREGAADSERERDAIVSALEEAGSGLVVSGLHVRVRAVPWSDPRQLSERLSERYAALYAGESLAAEASAVASAARAASILSFAPARDMVEAGLALGLVSRGNRAGVVVNLAAARAQGSDLDAALLAVVEVIHGPPPAPR
jgi:YfiR/HmsC-like